MLSDKRELLPVLLSDKSRKIKGSIYNRTQVDFAYNSNHIEGSRLTHDQTRYIYETHTIDGTVPFNDVFETVNHFRCFDYILDTVSEPITEDYMKQLHHMLKNGIMQDNKDYAVAGDYKKYPNEVGEMQTALPEDVSCLVQNLLQKYTDKPSLDLYDIAEFHAEFEKIHPLCELELMGYSIKRGKYISVKAEGQQRFVRTKTLGEDYTAESLISRIR